LKKQKDSLAPERQDGVPPGEVVGWTSGLIFGKGEVREKFGFSILIFIKMLLVSLAANLI